jgi:uncharacterized protein (DUF983 family)
MHARDTRVSLLKAASTGRCPRCGQGPLYQRGLALRDRCTNCGLDYRFIDTGDGPAVFATFILGLVVLGGALWVEFRFAPPLLIQVALWALLTPLLAFGLLRLLKAALVALQYRHKAEEGRLSRD